MASLLLTLVAAPAQAEPVADVDAPASTWFVLWCWDREFIYSTPGGAIAACIQYLPGHLRDCLPNCPPTFPGAATESSYDRTCLNGQSTAEKVRNCAYSLLVNGGSGTRMICVDRQMEDGNVVGVTWKCVDYQVFERIVCVEVRC